jgi:hypothetical protein
LKIADFKMEHRLRALGGSARDAFVSRQDAKAQRLGDLTTKERKGRKGAKKPDWTGFTG